MSELHLVDRQNGGNGLDFQDELTRDDNIRLEAVSRRRIGSATRATATTHGRSVFPGLAVGSPGTNQYGGTAARCPRSLPRTCAGFGALSLRAGRCRRRNKVSTAAAGMAARRAHLQRKARGTSNQDCRFSFFSAISSSLDPLCAQFCPSHS